MVSLIVEWLGVADGFCQISRHKIVDMLCLAIQQLRVAVLGDARDYQTMARLVSDVNTPWVCMIVNN